LTADDAAGRLFVYGTLMTPAVLDAVCGRALPRAAGTLAGYARYRLRRRVYPAIVGEHGASTTGLLCEGLDEFLWQRLDAWESPLYRRERVLVSDAGGGERTAHTYVLAARASPRARTTARGRPRNSHDCTLPPISRAGPARRRDLQHRPQQPQRRRPSSSAAARLRHRAGGRTCAVSRARAATRISNAARWPSYLGAAGIEYQWWGETLGRASHAARRFAQYRARPTPALRGYADHMLSPPFRDACAALVTLARARRCAFMCAEADYHHCHRQLLADHLQHAGLAVTHIIDAGHGEPHIFHAALGDAREPAVYNRRAQGDLFA
jgi:gamma-glutamylcyclotransferase (GGCT)/AIG2-like uncharacterized protein YtfP